MEFNVTLSPQVTTFNVTLAPAVTLNVTGGGGGGEVVSSINQKAGGVLANQFAGSPLKHAVIFDTPYADANYAINFSGADARFLSWENKTAAGFTINVNAAELTGNVDWITIPYGE